MFGNIGQWCIVFVMMVLSMFFVTESNDYTKILILFNSDSFIALLIIDFPLSLQFSEI